jgi:hypothetical protein
MSRSMKYLLVVLLSGLAVFALLHWLLVPIASPKPDNLGVNNGRLVPCLDSPNCVSTQAERSLHLIDPIRYETETAVIHQRLLRVLHEMPSAPSSIPTPPTSTPNSAAQPGALLTTPNFTSTKPTN